ncbi:hypothetical protein BDA96_02G059700 [Sorghum bicolor]|jgi:hypothetical protein|uniref:F-box domain-containing protein n=2 Tax=Sorghum bicolor TaxID=4558 RepID=A0A921RN04_SORBI|nr:F-box protein At1g30790 [Sorghum bicolor]KAG0541942.1 hypothetical protein BDA96_02G059700 [Sorghum bicolor]KXG34572.1 hypothetical protein SORBI_3002G059600 [Sorghum bicolor]|eukprot:XP_002461578.2 F-box protein At1g30790 [Sorghum bicolor]
MDGPKRTKAAAADGFPDDPVVKILSCLPAKPLFRFKCVSKGWCDLIVDRLGRRKFPQTLEGFFIDSSVGGGVNDLRFINLSGKSVPLVDASFSFLTKLPEIKQIKLLSAHNGLLLFENFIDCDRYKYIICNPATEQWMCVPSPGISSHPPRTCDCEQHFANEVNSLLIFNPDVSSHFHLLQFWHSNDETRLVNTVLAFSSETGVWRNSTTEWIKWREWMELDEVRSKLGYADVNGMLHVPVYPQPILTPSQRQDIKIVVADMQGKKLMAIHWPGLNEFTDATFIGQSQGHLHCITAHKKQDHPIHITGLSIWVLEDYDAGHWVLKKSVSCSQLFGEMSCGVNDLDVITIHPDRNLVFFVHRCSWKLMSYDMDTEEVCDLYTLGHGCGLIIPYVPYFADVPVLSGRASTDFLEGQPTIV